MNITDYGVTGNKATFAVDENGNVVTYKLTVTAKADSNFTGTVSKEFTVGKAKIDLKDVAWNYSAAFTYDGTAKSVALTNLPAGLDTLYTVSYGESILSATDADNYVATATFTIKDNNYEFTNNNLESCEWTINSATDNVGTLTADKEAWTYGDVVSYTATSKYGAPTVKYYDADGEEITVTEETKLSAGTYKVVATYEKSTNWNDVAPKEITFTVAQSHDYTASANAITNAVYGDLLSKFTVTGESSREGTWAWKNGTATVGNAGNRTATAIFTPNDKNYAPREVTVNITVDKATYDMSGVEWNYSAAFTYEKGTQRTVTLKTETLPTGVTVASYTGNDGESAGTYTASVTFSYDTANYYAPTIDVLTWNITPLYIDAPEQGTASHTYIGGTITFFDKTGEYWTATGAKTGEDVNAETAPYRVTIELTDPNCAWVGGSTADIVYEYHITKGTNEIYGTLTMGSWIYDGAASTPSGITGAKWGTEIKYQYRDVTNNGTWGAISAPTSTSNVGTYAVRAYVDGTDNYDICYSEPVEFVISLVEIIAPEINESQIYVVGGNNYPTLLGTETVLTEGDHGDYTVTYNFSGTLNVGQSYTVTVSMNVSDDVKSNYVWAGTNDNGNLTLTYTLTGQKATIEVDETNGIPGWTFGSKPTDAEYTAIIKALTTIYINNVGDVDQSGVSISLIYYDTNDEKATEISMPTAAGTYYFKIEVAAGAGYQKTTSEEFYQFTIAQATPEPTVPTGLTATYGDTLANVTLPNGWSWNDSTASVGNVGGDNKFDATFTPDDTKNYKTITVKVPVTVSAKSIILETNATDGVITSKSYNENGYKLSDVFTFQFKDGTEPITGLVLGTDYEIKVNGTAVTGLDDVCFTGAGKYTVVVTLLSGNYTTASVTSFEFTVTKINLTLGGTGLLSKGEEGSAYDVTATYGDTTKYHEKGADYFKTNLVLYNGESQLTTNLTLTINVNIYTEYDSATKVYSGAVTSITDVDDYYVVYTLADNVGYTMTSVTRVVKITKADPDVTVWPTYTGPTYKNIIDKTKISSTGRAAVEGTFTLSDPSFSGGNATFTITFTPGADYINNYNSDTETITVPLTPVATYKDTAYYSIYDAVTEANKSGGTVWVIPNTSGHVVINENLTINSNVTLVLPYAEYTDTDDASVRNQKNSDNHYVSTIVEDKSYVWNDTSRRVTLVVLDGATLNVQGTLDIAGQLSGKSSGNVYAGHTAGKYAELNMKNGATINCSGTIVSLGFITDSGSGNSISVTGSVYQPFVLLDFLGGSYMYGMYSDLMKEPYNLSPFQEFVFMNVHPKVTYYHNSNMYGCANLYANDQHNPTTTTIIGNNSGSLLQTVAGGRIESDYDPVTQVTDLDVYGGATLNSLSLKVNAGYTVTISTSNVYFPLSWLYDISLNPTDEQKAKGTIADYTINQMIQILWGSKLLIAEGSKLTVNGSMLIHDGDYFFTYLGATQKYGDELHKESPVVIVNGELVATSVSGKISSGVNGAKVTANNSISISVYNASVTGSSFLATGSAMKIHDSQLRLLYGENNSLSMLGASGMTMTYVLNETMNTWIGDNVYVAFDPNGGEYSGVGRIQVGIDKTNLTYVTPAINVTDPTREYYTFGGWYLDRACTISYVAGETKNITDMTVYLYAKWIPKTYNVEYEYVSDTLTALPDNLPSPDALSEITVETPGTLPSPKNVAGWYFLGWYLDSKFTQKVISYADITKVDGSVTTVYGRWTDVPTYVVEITNPNYPNGDESGLQSSINVTTEDYINGSLEMFEAQFLNDNRKAYYISGWINNATGLPVTDWKGVITENDFAASYSISPVWSTKYIITISGSNGLADPYALSVSGLTGFGSVNYAGATYTGGFYTLDQIKALLGSGANYTYVTQFDSDAGVSKYFKGWKIGDIEDPYPDIADIPTSYIEGSMIAIEAVWADKVTVTVNYSGNSKITINPDTVYIKPGATYSINADNVAMLDDYDNDLTANLYYGGMVITGDGNNISGSVISIADDYTGDATASVVWKYKYAIEYNIKTSAQQISIFGQNIGLETNGSIKFSGTGITTKTCSASAGEGNVEQATVYFIPGQVVDVQVSGDGDDWKITTLTVSYTWTAGTGGTVTGNLTTNQSSITGSFTRSGTITISDVEPTENVVVATLTIAS